MRYIFATLFFNTKRSLVKLEITSKALLVLEKSTFRIEMFKFHGLIKCLSRKQQKHFTEQFGKFRLMKFGQFMSY